MEQNGGDDRKLPWGVQGKTENVCQEVEKPTDRDHVEGTDSGGLGTACEKSREGGEEMENICSVYLLRSKMHDHNPFTVPEAFLFVPLSLHLLSSHCFLIYPSRSFLFLSHCAPPPPPPFCHVTAE